MGTVLEIKQALEVLPITEKRQIADWLAQELRKNSACVTKTTSSSTTGKLRLPDYAARRKAIFGEKVLPNMVLLAREEERW